jgi:ClpP class serine protease
MQQASWQWDSYESIQARVEAALASHLPALLLSICSPGGQVAGCFELADEIRATAGAAGKRVVAYVDGMAASAAYALACAAERIYVPSTGLVGSIGCMQISVDATAADRAMGLGFEVFASGARKADGNPHVAMSEGARGAIQANVDAMAETFFSAVAAARGLSPVAVAALDAGVFIGAKAVVAGLADAVMTLADVLASNGQPIGVQAGAEATTMDEKEIKSALKAIAEGKDEKAAARAKAALAAMDSDKSEDEADGEEPKKDPPKAEADGEEPKKDPPKDEKEAEASSSLALAAKVQSLSAKFAAREEAEERAALMASRPDFAPEVVALMERSPLSIVRDAVKSLPRGAVKAKGQIGAARAALEVQGTTGASHAEAGDRLPAAEAYDLDVAMGLKRGTVAIRHEGNRLILGVMTPAEARAQLAQKGQASK